MKSFQIKSGDQTVTFTSSELLIGDSSCPYSGITMIRHSADRRAYAFLCGGKTAAFAYEPKDAAAVHALMERIAAMRHLTVEELPVQDQNPAPEEAPENKSHRFNRPLFTGIEAGAAGLLLVLGVWLFLTI
ncbi:MAG: hypothetical protein IJ128_06900 [Firmicutes bacterium]|nr:hypothetical protein [Bacillota bacterium]